MSRLPGLSVWSVLLIASAVAPAADGLVPSHETPSAPRESAAGLDQKLGAQVDLNLTFRDETGEPITLAQAADGKPVVLILAYYRCPMLCNQVLNGLLDVARKMPFNAGKEYTILVVSFDPKEKSPLASMKKKSYVGEYGREGADNGWRFLTGDKEAIASLTETVGFRFEYDKVLKEYNHPSGVTILTPSGVVSKYFFGIMYSPIDLRLALTEASEGTVGSLSEQLLLMCYRYDHTTGKYSFSIMMAVKVLGVVTVLAVAAGLIVAFRWERRRRALEVPTA